MPAQPEVGQTYRWSTTAGQAEDRTAVLSLDEQGQVTLRPLQRRAVVPRTTPYRAGRAFEYKLYAKAVGQVLEVTVSSGSERRSWSATRGKEAGAALDRSTFAAPDEVGPVRRGSSEQAVSLEDLDRARNVDRLAAVTSSASREILRSAACPDDRVVIMRMSSV